MKYYLKVFGCQMNISDSERIASFLEQQHYQNTDKMEGADLIVIVACSVRQSAINRIFGLNKKFKNLRAKKILTGCVLKQDKIKFKNMFDEILSINEFLGTNYLELQPKHIDKIRWLANAFVPIMTGCNNFCTYCAVPYTRGREISRPAKNIINEVKNLIKRGYNEITLLGQNVNSYNNFPKLLKTIAEIPGNFTIKFLTSHPKDMSDALINVIANSPKISREIHLPVQSGDNEILRKMNRNYTREHYFELINKIRNKIPQSKITTDVIVGFPGETKKQFQNTVDLFRRVGFDLAYINKYSPRPGTAAAQFKDDVPWNEKVRRWEVLEKIANSSQPKADPPRADKVIVMLGPTASGKSDLAVDLALRLRSGRPPLEAEIISADSRQIYKGMDIGTGKITKREMHNIPHYMLDIVSPKKQFSVAEYKQKAEKIIQQIIKKQKTPIICGGTGFYIQALIDNIVIPKVKPDWKLRNKLEKQTEAELFKQLEKLDPERAKTIDKKNKRRLIRAIEIVLKTKKPVPQILTNPQYDTLYLGIKKSIPELKELIHKRLIKRMDAGMIDEIKKLRKQGVSWKRLDDFGLEYRYVARYLQGILTKEQMIEQLEQQIIKFAKRQLTWFKKYPGDKVHWISDYKTAEKLVKDFLS